MHSDAWKARLANLYRGIDPLHPYQVMGFDSNGIQPNIPAIGFSGIRFVQFRKIAFIMGPSSLFGYTLLSLLLGAGFLHGACGSPIKEEDRLIDGLIWWSPLRC
uniref:Uncharacterized protein n=1 Tax=Alexandrium andersonii TaxID=327968 RepID=A0A7S2FDJ7_9DINO